MGVATANSVLIISFANERFGETVQSGGVVSNAVISGGNLLEGLLYVESGGSATGATIYVDAAQIISSGGVATGTTDNDGYEYVYLGGLAQNTLVSATERGARS